MRKKIYVKLIERIAELYGVTAEEVESDMQIAIDEAMKTSDSRILSVWTCCAPQKQYHLQS